MNATSNTIARQRGIATLEFWLTAPFLLLVVFAVSELGWAFSHYHAMTRATRDGARHVATSAMNGSIGLILLESTLVQQTRNLVVYGNPTGAGEPLLPGWAASDVSVTAPDASHVTVSATYSYIPLIGRIPAFYGGEPISMAFEMRSSVHMRAL